MERRDNNSSVYRLVNVGMFSDVRDVDGGDSCIGNVQLGTVYVVFLSDRTWIASGSDASSARQKTAFYSNTGLPVESSEAVLQTVKKFSCPNCGRLLTFYNYCIVLLSGKLYKLMLQARYEARLYVYGI